MDENLLQSLKREQFIQRLAYFYDQVNYIHPFREGNGRTQRLFFDEVAVGAGYKINWLKVTGKQNDEASKLAAQNQDMSLLVEMFEVAVISPREEQYEK
ncbi:MAG: Fic family protein [Candidatus Ancillula sp.]|nr:Fic family protein [Candidatus Ancillula sp.]